MHQVADFIISGNLNLAGKIPLRNPFSNHNRRLKRARNPAPHAPPQQSREGGETGQLNGQGIGLKWPWLLDSDHSGRKSDFRTVLG